jgi:hypothetical protein
LFNLPVISFAAAAIICCGTLVCLLSSFFLAGKSPPFFELFLEIVCCLGRCT